MHRLAIYDMDKTITRTATWTPFLRHALQGRSAWRLALLPAAALAGAGYGLKLLDRGQLKEATQRLLIGRSMTPARARALAEDFADQLLRTGLFGGAVERIEADRRAGYRLVLATASWRFYVEAIAERLGFDAVIATNSRHDARGHLLSSIEGENCYGPVKLRMIENWLAEQGIARGDAHVRFYSDHVSDAPTLAWADEPFAVNAHGPLRRLATEKGWPILDWEY